MLISLFTFAQSNWTIKIVLKIQKKKKKLKSDLINSKFALTQLLFGMISIYLTVYFNDKLNLLIR